MIPEYLRALQIELQAGGGPHPVDTLYIGGGTPSHLNPQDLACLLDLVCRWYPPADGAEFSVEANPSDITAERVDVFANAGVNRISLGVQSFNDTKLRVLERDHDRSCIERSVALIQDRISNWALDLIFAVPGETRTIWQDDLRTALALQPKHVSTYGLTYERGTQFWSRRQRNDLVVVDEDNEVWMYRTGIDVLKSAGMEHYEISNLAQPQFRSRHNQVYWSGDEYFAVGPGASRFLEGRRETNHRSTTTYLRRVLSGQTPVAESEVLTVEQRARERLVFGLRRLEGVNGPKFAESTGFTIEQLVGEALTEYCQRGWLVWAEDRLQLTEDGLLCSDSIWPDFI